MWVIKMNGEKEKFQPEKIRKTCLRAGATLKIANKIVNQVQKRSYNGITTRKILKSILRYLEKEEPIVATRYNLKEAIMRLGPTGFTFEKLIKEILKAYGYKARLPKILQGACVKHEIDVVAEKEKCYMIECKYHNAPGIYSGIKNALCTYARFLDLKEGFKKNKCPIKFDQPLLICNTKFSKDTLQYALCKKIKLISWKYPRGKGLRELLERKNLYPITILRTINKSTQKILAGQGIMFCHNLIKEDFKKLKKLTNLDRKQLENLIKEAKAVMQNKI